MSMATATALSPLLPLFSYFFFLDFFVFLWEGEKGVCKKKKWWVTRKNFCARLESEIMKGGGERVRVPKKVFSWLWGRRNAKLWKFREKWGFWRLMSKVLINFWRFFFLSKFSKNFSPLFFAKTLKFYIFMCKIWFIFFSFTCEAVWISFLLYSISDVWGCVKIVWFYCCGNLQSSEWKMNLSRDEESVWCGLCM